MLETSESIAKIAASLAKAQGSMRAALKDSVNPHFRSRYADLAGVWDACREPLASNGLAVVQTPGEISERSITLTTLLCHESGEWMRSAFTIPVSKADAQGVGSAVTYARRYALAAMVGIVQDDDDGNAATGPALQRKPAPAPRPQPQPQDPVAQPQPQPQEFNLVQALEAIQQSKSIDELKGVYADAYAAADVLGDDKSLEQIVRAKDKRKSELATTAAPSRTKAAVKAKAAPAPEPVNEDADEIPFGDAAEGAL